MNTLLVCIILFMGFCQVFADTPVTACDVGILPTGVLVGSSGLEPCQESPCEINPSRSVVLDMNFTAPVYMENPWQKVYVDLIHTTFDLIEHDACKGITNTVCPVVEGEEVSYHFELALWDLIPEVTVGLQFYLQADEATKESAVCFNIKVKIVKS